MSDIRDKPNIEHLLTTNSTIVITNIRFYLQDYTTVLKARCAAWKTEVLDSFSWKYFEILIGFPFQGLEIRHNPITAWYILQLTYFGEV